MSGTLLKILPKQVFDFGPIEVGATQVITLAQRIPIAGYTEGVLVVHVFSATGSGSITFELCADGNSEEEPGRIFVGTPLFSSRSILLLLQTPPFLDTYGGTTKGELALLRLTATRSAPGAINATVAIDLLLRNPD